MVQYRNAFKKSCSRTLSTGIFRHVSIVFRYKALFLYMYMYAVEMNCMDYLQRIKKMYYNEITRALQRLTLEMRFSGSL